MEWGSIVQPLHIPAVCQLLPSAPLCNEICCTGISAQTKLLLLNGKTPTPNAFAPTTRLGPTASDRTSTTNPHRHWIQAKLGFHLN